MKTEQILQLVEAVSGFGLDEFEYEEDGVKLKLKKGGNVCTSVSAETAGRTKTEAEIARTEENAEVLLEGKIVKAPLVGIFYASPEEGGTPFVQAGDKVEKGTVLGIVEAMKLMNEIESDFEGTIEEVLVENGAAVEYGQPLFVIKYRTIQKRHSKNIREAEYGDGKRDKEKLKYRTDPADHPAQASVLPDRQDRRL